MASPFVFENGLGGTTGDEFATAAGPVLATVQPIYISSTGGAAGGDGSREYPYASLATTVGLGLSAGQTFVLMASHAETITSTLAINVSNLWIIGEGDGSSRPRLTAGAGSTSMLDLTGAGCRLRGIYFPASAAVVTTRVKLNANGLKVENCYFECGANDSVAAVNAVGAGATERVLEFRNTTFASVSTSLAARPLCGIDVITAALTQLDVVDCTFDGGTVGFSSYALRGSQTVNRPWIQASFLNGADLSLATASVGRASLVNKSGNPMVNWAA